MTADIAEAILDIEVDSFCGDFAQGNRHRLLVLEQESQNALSALTKLSSQTDDIIIGLFLSADIPSGFFFQRGQVIRRCGSGNLACAYALDTLYSLEAELEMKTCDGPVTLLAYNNRYGYQIHNPLPYSECTSPSLARCFDLPPEHIILCGSDTDYSIFVYRDPEALMSLQANFSHIQKTTQRALIATAPSPHDDGDYALRYFAPQWGNNEDAATGSANAILGPYWGKRLGLTELHSYQLSAAGGEFWIQLNKPEADSQRVTLLGRCRRYEPPTGSFVPSR